MNIKIDFNIKFLYELALEELFTNRSINQRI